MSLEGYSYYQKGSIDVLTEEVGKKEVDVAVKVATSEYNGTVQSLDAKDNSHFNRINNLKQVKVALSDYNTKMASMDNEDTQHNIKLNTLDTDYGTKASKMVFDNTFMEMQALDENHDMRLDEIDKRFSTIHTHLYETVVQQLGEKINSADFYALINEVNVGQTGLAEDIATLLLQNEMDAVNANQNLLIAEKADKAEFENDAEAIDERHLDIEKRLLAIDQFLRLMSQTYKIYNKTTKEEIKYNANLLPVATPPTFSVIGRKTLISGNSRSIDRTNISFVDNVVVQLTEFGYNTLTGSISIFNQNGDVIGSISQEDVNPVTKNVDVPLIGATSGTIQVSQVSSDNTPIFAPPPITTVTALPDLTPVDIINTNTTINGVINSSVLLENDIQGTGTITVSPALPSGLTHQILNRKLRIFGTPTQAVPVSTPYTITVANGFSSDSIIVNIRVIELAPTYTYNASYTFMKKRPVQIVPVKTDGSDATSWSIADANNVLGSIGLTFNSNGTIAGISTGVLPETEFTVTYSNSGGQGTATFKLTINPETPIYSIQQNHVFTKGQTINMPIPTLVGGDPATSWSITPALPSGFIFNTSTGEITGTANVESPGTNYIITYSNVSGSGSRQINIRVNLAEPTYTYSSSYTFTKGVAITTITPTKTSGDDATTWSISPALSAGLSFNTSTGVISGTPTVAQAQTSYTVSYGNSGGDKIVFFTITVNIAPPVYNSYSPSTYTYKVGDTVSIPFPALASGDAATLWQISPIIQGGLVFNTGTGLISGVTNAVVAQTTYTITFSNSAGSGTRQITITIDPLVNSGDVYYTRNASNSISYDTSIDSFGNTYVSYTSQHNRSLSINGISTYKNSPISGSTNGAIVKYNNNGDVMWARYVEASVISFDVDDNLNIYAYGLKASGENRTANTAVYGNTADSDYVMKISPNGDSIWIRFLPRSAISYICKISVSRFNGQVYIPGSNESSPPYSGRLISIDTNGNQTWSRSLTLSGTDTDREVFITSVVADTTGVYIAGWMNKRNFTINEISFNNTRTLHPNASVTEDGDAFVIKYNLSGIRLWAKWITGTTSATAESIAVDSSSNVYVVGLIRNGRIVGFTEKNSFSGLTTYVAKYTSTGAESSILYLNADQLHDITAVGSNIYVAGFVSGNLNTGTAVNTRDARDGFVLKLNNNLDANWIRYSGSSWSNELNYNINGQNDRLVTSLSGYVSFSATNATIFYVLAV